MIHAIAIDDEPPALRVIENFCKQIDFIDLQKTFNQPSEGIKHMNKFPVDLLFLDIQMPAMTGIELMNSVKQNTMVIFTTAHSQYAVSGFELNAVDYLLKPYTFERFQQAVMKAAELYKLKNQQSATANRHLFVRADYSLIKVDISNIYYIEGLDDYLKIHIEGQKSIVTRMTMKNILEKLPVDEFVRVHRSFIIPVKRIKNIRNKTILLDKVEIPIGISYEESFLKFFHSI